MPVMNMLSEEKRKKLEAGGCYCGGYKDFLFFTYTGMLKVNDGMISVRGSSKIRNGIDDLRIEIDDMISNREQIRYS